MNRIDLKQAVSDLVGQCGYNGAEASRLERRILSILAPRQIRTARQSPWNEFVRQCTPDIVAALQDVGGGQPTRSSKSSRFQEQQQIWRIAAVLYKHAKELDPSAPTYASVKHMMQDAVDKAQLDEKAGV